MPLASARVSNAETERKVQELVYEFLKWAFSGQPVSLGGETVTYPACTFLFNQAEDATGADANQILPPVIHTVFSDLRPTAFTETATSQMVLAPLTLTFYVRVRKPAAEGAEPDQVCRLVADGLRRLFETEAAQLAARGIKHARLRRGPVPLSTPGVATRLVIAAATVLYRAPR